MPKEDEIYLANLTKDEFAVAVQAGRWILLPFGAVEQHGPHLPLGTDLYYAEHVCAAVARRSGLLGQRTAEDWIRTDDHRSPWCAW